MTKPELIGGAPKLLPCGCVHTEMSNGTTNVQPCLPCGLQQTAAMIAQAAQVLMATAENLRRRGKMNGLTKPPGLM